VFLCIIFPNEVARVFSKLTSWKRKLLLLPLCLLSFPLFQLFKTGFIATGE